MVGLCICLGREHQALANSQYELQGLQSDNWETSSTGVPEPEASGAIAWLLLQAYFTTHQEEFRQGAELAMEFLDGLTSNPSYELQLSYGVTAVAAMNAIVGTNYNLTKMLSWCFVVEICEAGAPMSGNG